MRRAFSRSVRAFALVGLLGFWVSAEAAQAMPPSLEVTTTADVVADDGSCSLREAIHAAFSEQASGKKDGECRAGRRGLDSIALPKDVRLVVAEPLLVVSELLIEGNGATVDGALKIPMIFATLLDPIEGADVGTLELRDLTITGAAAGEETAAVADFGFGITLRRCHVHGNRGWAALGRVKIQDSTLSDNRSGHLRVHDEVVEVTNSTLSDTPGTAIRAEGGARVALRNVTLADHGLALSSVAAEISLENTLLASQGRGENCRGLAPVLGAMNFADDASCGRRLGLLRVAPLALEPLGDNGGSTPTHALGPGNPAISGGDTLVCQGESVRGVDQRGVRRDPITCAAGAFEVGSASAPTHAYLATLALAPSVAFCLVAFVIRSRLSG